MQRALLLWVVVAFIPRAAAAQEEPVGPEFRVSTYTTHDQKWPDVAAGTSGNFVVVWESAQDSGFGVFGQRYASTGEPLGPEFRVNTYTTSYQSVPAVAVDPSGNFVVVWESHAQDGFNTGVFGQRYDSTGAPLGPEFRVNTHTTTFQSAPAVASDASGNFVVVWHSWLQDDSRWGVFGQRYASTGAPLGPEFRVNTYTTDSQASPAVASDASGNFVVVWASNTQDGSHYGIFGQRYASTGAPVGPEFRVNTYTTLWQVVSAVAWNSSGNFVVAWDSYEQDGSNDGVFGQTFASSGAPLGFEFRVNKYRTLSQNRPDVAAHTSGNFVVVWQSSQQDGDYFGVFGHVCCSSTRVLGPEFPVNTYTPNDQSYPAVASDSLGNGVVVWMSWDQDGDGWGVFGQRYSAIAPAE